MVDDWVAPQVLSPSAKAIAVEVLVHGAQSRARLADRMGLSAASLTRLVKPLLAAGVLVEEEAVRDSQRGRSSLPLDVVENSRRFVGIKLTTDTAYAVVTDLRARILDRVVAPLPPLDVPHVTATVLALVDELRTRGSGAVDALGVTVGGSVVGGDLVADSPYLHWHDVPFRSLVQDALSLPVHLDNDVVGLTKAQHWFGSGTGYADFALLTVGAGIGYGLVLDDVMVPVPLGLFAHYPIDPGGPLCQVGHRGCLTSYATTRSITSAASVAHDRPIGYAEVMDLARNGDPVASRLLAEAAHALGKAAAGVAATTGVPRIILSGEGVHLAEVARSALDAGLDEYHPPGVAQAEPVIQPMDFFEWARGAAVVAIQEEWPPPVTAPPEEE